RDLQLRDYTSVRHYSLRNQRFDTRATMTVRMTYRFPGQKRFEVMEESGSPTVRKKVLRRMLESELEASRDVARRESTQITPANYTFRLVGSETVSGRQCFVLQADPKTRNQFLFKGRLWVDSDDYAVTRIEGTPAQNPSIWLRKTTFRSEEHTSELQSRGHLVCRLLLEKKKKRGWIFSVLYEMSFS